LTGRDGLRGLVGPETGPREGVQAETDGLGIQRIDRNFEIQAQFLAVVHGPDNADQGLGEVLPAPPIAYFIGTGQRVAGVMPPRIPSLLL